MEEERARISLTLRMCPEYSRIDFFQGGVRVGSG